MLNNTTCICNTNGYYDNGVSDVCPACSYTCLTCNFSSTSSCLSCNTSNFRYDDGAGSCPCLVGYYDSGSKTCQKCHFSCVTCNGGNGADRCLTCPSLAITYRNASGGYCNCIVGYYSITNVVVCAKCSNSCYTCVNSPTNCTSCLFANKRTFSNASNTCPCNVGYYDDGSSATCLPCNSTCAGCNGPASTDCTSCNSALNRGLNSPTGQCLCITSFYEYNNLCYACHYSCLNCTNNTATSCISCKTTTAFRDFHSATNMCICKDGYFEKNVAVCGICDFTCLTCSLAATNCTTCSPTEYRILVGNSCPCIDGYVDVLGNCTVCHYSCLTCNGILAT